MGKEMINGAEAIMQSLINEGVSTIFGYPGGAAIPIYDALYTHKKSFDFILCRHEQGVTHSAEGYARVSGKVGVAIVTSGPGATNTITGIADAMMDSTPLVVICGQVSAPLLGTDAFQETDVVGITQPTTKWSYQVRSAQEIPQAIARAFYIASEGRPGPVVLDIAKNAQVEMLDFEYKKCSFIRSYEPYETIKEIDIQKAAEIINTAKKPFALVGQGVVLGNAEKEVIAFLEKAQIPSGSTLLGLSALPSNHPLNKGMLGMHGNVGPIKKIDEADVIIAIGMRFDDRVTGDLNTFAKKAKVIHLDIDPSEIDKNVKTDVAIVGNVKISIPLLTQAININDHKDWIDSFKPLEEEEFKHVIYAETEPSKGDITMGEVVKKVTDATDHDGILVSDVGQNQMISARYFKYSQTRSIVTSGGLGTEGFGLPAAIGAALGAPQRTVCLFAGDGGIQMTIQELGTIMEYDIPVKIIILNNHFLGMVRQWQELFYRERYSATPMKNPDFCKIADAYNIKNKHVTKRKNLDAAIKEMITTQGPYLLNVEVEENGMVYPMVPAGKSSDDLILGD